MKAPTKSDRKIAELDDRVKRLVQQLARLQVENKELRIVNNKAFEVLRGGL